MKRAFTIFTAVTKNWMRSRSGLFFSILFPVILLLVFGAIFSGGGNSTYELFVQNLDRKTDGTSTDLSDDFVKALNSTETFTIRNISADISDAESYARDALGPLGGNIRILIVQKGFQDDLLNGTFKVRVGISYSTLNTTYQYFATNQTLRDAAKQGIDQMGLYYTGLPDRNASLTLIIDSSDQSSGIVKSIVINIANAFNYKLIGAENVIAFKDQQPTAVRRFRNIDFYLPGVIAAFIMTNGIIGVTTNTTEFKRRGIIKRLSITPLSKIDWIVGNVLSQTLLNLMLTAIIIVVGWLVFNVQAIPDAISVVLIFLGSVMFSGIGMTLSGLVKDVEAASAVGNAIAFPMMFLSGTFFPVEVMPAYLQSFARVLPLTYFTDGLRYAMIFKYSQGIYTNMALVSVLAVAFIIIGALVTRWKEK